MQVVLSNQYPARLAVLVVRERWCFKLALERDPSKSKGPAPASFSHRRHDVFHNDSFVASGNFLTQSSGVHRFVMIFCLRINQGGAEFREVSHGATPRVKLPRRPLREDAVWHERIEDGPAGCRTAATIREFGHGRHAFARVA